MLKAMIEKLQEMSRPAFHEVEGRTFFVNGDGFANEVRPSLNLIGTLALNSLDALVKMVKTEAKTNYATPLYITIPDHLTAVCYSQPSPDLRNARTTYYEATATDVPANQPAEKMAFEEAMIALRTRFQETPDTLYALRLLSGITTGAKMTINDNGIATTIVTHKCVATQANETIRPIITLKPYRTFQEVEQPASQFLIRVSERGISFIEADGGMWKLEARKTIMAYLVEAFEAEIADGTVVIAL